MDMQKQFIHLHEAWRQVSEALRPYQIVLAGGAVRDFYFGKEVKDYDLFILEDLNPYELWEVRKTINKEFPKAENLLTEGMLEEAFLYEDTIKSLDKIREKEGKPRREGPGTIIKICDIPPDPSRSYITKPMQIIIKLGASNVQDLLGTFDLDICRIAYDGQTFIEGEGVDMRAVSDAMLRGGPLKLYFQGSFARLKRFRERYGCDIEEASKTLLQILEREGGGDKGFFGKGKKDLEWLYARKGVFRRREQGEDVNSYLEELYSKL